jgi:hypothetical protein
LWINKRLDERDKLRQGFFFGKLRVKTTFPQLQKFPAAFQTGPDICSTKVNPDNHHSFFTLNVLQNQNYQSVLLTRMAIALIKLQFAHCNN